MMRTFWVTHADAAAERGLAPGQAAPAQQCTGVNVRASQAFSPVCRLVESFIGSLLAMQVLVGGLTFHNLLFRV